MPSLQAESVKLLARLILRRRFSAPRSPEALRADAVRLDIGPGKLVADMPGREVTMQGVATEVFAPSEPGPRVLLYFTGGGFMVTAGNQHRRFLQHLARAVGATGYLPRYRLAPEHPFPAGLDDCLAVYRALLRSFRPSQIALIGDSSGGNLALAVIDAARRASVPMPAAAYLISPLTDMASTGRSMFQNARLDPLYGPEAILHKCYHYLAGANPLDPLVSPLFGDLSKLPPTLIHVGECEVMLDDSTRLADRARAAGSAVNCRVWKGMFHTFPLLMGLPESRDAFDEATAFLKRSLTA